MGLVAVVANITAVVLLSQKITSAYRIEELCAWNEQVIAAPGFSDGASILFIIGVLALIPYAWGHQKLLPSSKSADLGFLSVTLGAILNALGCTFPLYVTRHLGASHIEAKLWLERALVLDAAFNLFFGVGLLLFAKAGIQSGRWRRLHILCLVAGFFTVPVSLQFMTDTAARLLAVAGPLWLASVTAFSVILMKKRFP
jgi:hypothetical protein